MAAMHRHSMLVLAAVALLVPALATAQRTTRASTRQADERAEHARREALLEQLDSLRWHFEHERMSDGERERIRIEMRRAFRALDEAMAGARAVEEAAAGEAARAIRVWSSTPQVAVSVGPRVRPRGYIGLLFDGPNTEDVRDGEVFVRFYQYPLIALVEPASPAERAGIRQGDTLLALNGSDVLAEEIALSRLLVPEKRLTVRVRRDGDTKNLPVVVKSAPEYVVRRAMPTRVSPAPAPPRTARTPEGPVAVTIPAPAPPAARGFVWVSSDGFGGAKLEQVTHWWSRALGAGSGVVVVRATAGSPAYESGLRDGDVIVRAAGKPVSTVRELRNTIMAQDAPDVKLVIVRERKQRELTFRLVRRGERPD